LAVDPDTANARGLGSYKADTFKKHRHDTWATHEVIADAWSGGNVSSTVVNGNGHWQSRSALTEGGGGAETAPKSVAFHPRIHV